MLLYGEPRLTRDIDITLGVDVDRLTDLMTLVDQLHLRCLAEPESFARRTMVMPCADPETGIRIDFIFLSRLMNATPSPEPLLSTSVPPTSDLPPSKTLS